MVCINLSVCIIKWLIYITSGIVLIMAVVLFIMDIRDTGRTNSPVGPSIGLLVLMLLAGGTGLLHCYSPRLIFIVVMVLLSALYLVLRFPFAPLYYRPLFMLPIMFDAIFGCIYFYLVAFKIEHDLDETSWKTLTKVSYINSSSPKSSSIEQEQEVKSRSNRSKYKKKRYKGKK